MNSRNIIILVIMSLCFTTTYSCQKEKFATEYYWAETGCSDPWNTNSNNSDSEVKKAVVDYLENENIKVFDVSIDQDRKLMESCEACHCITGRRIVVSVDKENRIEEIGLKPY